MVTKTVVIVNKGGQLKDVSFKDFDIFVIDNSRYRFLISSKGIIFMIK